ncbi:MAG: OmpH family outer membrane protein [Bacteroides sp.]|nr:OmpH family outer membrane protein [Bacteroidales bacterium]MBD5206224.1 OmpH family outer membrane protein [Bacteroidales bacterium]MBD5223462.1 OmpH family outer membrane protein [Bacteroidales bacterium]MBD5302595.1 OmpH family outer membrane protein [Bacteroides sp.]MBD5305015.1 OmpH family outer membrane protein [Bacteroides sp.]
MLKKILLAVALMLPLFGASAQTTVKLGLVDTGAVLQALPDTQEAQKKVQEASKKYEDEYARLGEEMKRMYDELNNMKPDELPAIKERKMREFQDYQAKVQTFEQNAQQDLQRMQSELLNPIFLKIKDAVESVGKEGGFSMIQDYNPQQTLFYAAPVVDVTPQVKSKLGIK